MPRKIFDFCAVALDSTHILIAGVFSISYRIIFCSRIVLEVYGLLELKFYIHCIYFGCQKGFLASLNVITVNVISLMILLLLVGFIKFCFCNKNKIWLMLPFAYCDQILSGLRCLHLPYYLKNLLKN
jgi:hypothetical protein